jgi:hypothetical protein
MAKVKLVKLRYCAGFAITINNYLSLFDILDTQNDHPFWIKTGPTVLIP